MAQREERRDRRQTPRETEVKRLFRALMRAFAPDGETPADSDNDDNARRLQEMDAARAVRNLGALRKFLLQSKRLVGNERRRLRENFEEIQQSETFPEELRTRARRLMEQFAEVSLEGMWELWDEAFGLASEPDPIAVGEEIRPSGWDDTDLVFAEEGEIADPFAPHPLSYAEKKRPRFSFASHRPLAQIPPLVKLQKKSFADFLQVGRKPSERDDKQGLQGAFNAVFPIESSSGTVSLHFRGYELRAPKYTVPECKLRGLTYQSSVYASIEMRILDKKGGVVKEIKEDPHVYMGEMPLMTEDGSFVINGTERVVVSQVHRSPGVFFDHDWGRNTGGKYIYSGRIIPYYGSWVDFEFDKRDLLYFRVDRRRKMPATILLKAFGFSKKRILEEFYDSEDFVLGAPPIRARRAGRVASVAASRIVVRGDADGVAWEDRYDLPRPSGGRPEDKLAATAPKVQEGDEVEAGDLLAKGEPHYKLRGDFLLNVSLPFDLRDKQGKTLVSSPNRIKKMDLRKLAPLENSYHPTTDEFLYGRRLAHDVFGSRVAAAAGDDLTREMLESLRGKTLVKDAADEDGEILAAAGTVLSPDMLPREEAGAPRRLGSDLVVNDLLGAANTEITPELLKNLRGGGVTAVQTLYMNEFDRGPFIAQTLAEDRLSFGDDEHDREKSREAIYRVLRPGDPPNREVVNNHLDAIFYDSSVYSLSEVGRMKFNRRLFPGRPAMEYKIVAYPEMTRLNKTNAAAAVAALSGCGVFDGDDNARRKAAADYVDYIRHFGVKRALAENLSKEEAETIVSKLGGDFRARIREQTTLSAKDFLAAVKYLADLRNGKEKVDDIDNLSNRRVRAVGEFIENQFTQGLQRVQRAIRDRLSRAEVDGLMPNNLISAKAVTSAVSEFFNGNQLSQFMDQTNPLAEITHKRRVSAFGVGGLNRDRVGFEVRDVHPSHYGRLCPIETPEGPNIGLINSMSLYAEVDAYGFLRTPYAPVKNGKVVADKVRKLSAIDEQGKVIAQGNSRRDGAGRFVDELTAARRDGEYILCPPSEVDYMDIAPSQIASAAASLIPFLEHDDANRALMGSNMQRQAVPCLQAEKPLVGTGVEMLAARDSGATLTAKRGGQVSYVDSDRIAVRANEDEIRPGESGVDIYNLLKHTRSNQNTDMLQRPIIREGDTIAAGDIIADGAATDLGDLALGQNLLVAFLPWNGYNFEDSILISERVVMEQRYSSVHIIEESVHARVMPFLSGSGGDKREEEITRDVPHQSEASLAHLDEEGIVHVGAHVRPGDILVGKITPKGERQLTPEEKLLRAVFGEKADDVKDTSLRMPPGGSGVVIDVKVFNGEEIKKRTKKGASSSDKRMRHIQDAELREFKRDQQEAWRIIEEDAMMRIRALVLGKKSEVAVGDIEPGTVLSAKSLAGLRNSHWLKLRVKDKAANAQIAELEKLLKTEQERQKDNFAAQKRKLEEGHALQQGVLKTVKVYVAIKRNLQTGDKMAGRHGNKGVVSKIVPVESMPYLADGTPVDVVLSPLGVPSRMNAGQILETHLGLAAKGLGDKLDKMLRGEKAKQSAELRAFMKKVYAGDGNGFDPAKMSDEELLESARHLCRGVPFATPIFDGASEEDIRRMLKLADLPTSGQLTLYDGCSGEPFERPVTVGCMYMLKLHHLVDEKMHARSTGPYSLITQQPLGGKAQRGGQRFGEMEVWALEAYGAAYTLCEMLTVKSDDVEHRAKMFESIAEGDFHLRSGVPESFRVLEKEIRALAIDMETGADHDS